MSAVLDKVRSQIQARGAKTIRGLGRTFRNFDSFDGNHKIDKEEFYSGLCEIQVKVTRDEANVSSPPAIEPFNVPFCVDPHGPVRH